MDKKEEGERKGCGSGGRMLAIGMVLMMWMWGGAGWVWAESAFEQGNRFFKEGKLDEAEAAYYRQLETGGETAALRFNLGKVREALGDPGGAMVEWERALRVDRGHEPSRAALAAARRAVGARGVEERWWVGVQPRGLEGQEGWVVAMGVWGVVLAFLGRWIWKVRLGVGFGVALASGGVALLGLLWWREARGAMDRALVKERSVTARSAPAEPSRSVGEFPAGTVVWVVGESAGWSRCVLPEGGVGWLPSQGIERIVPRHP